VVSKSRARRRGPPLQKKSKNIGGFWKNWGGVSREKSSLESSWLFFLSFFLSFGNYPKRELPQEG